VVSGSGAFGGPAPPLGSPLGRTWDGRPSRRVVIVAIVARVGAGSGINDPYDVRDAT
jgi:hypothetical protein